MSNIVKVRCPVCKKKTNAEQIYMKETLSRLLEEKQMGSLFKVIFGYKNKNNNFFGFE